MSETAEAFAVSRLQTTPLRPETWGFYQKHILRLLRQLHEGYMTLTLPDGAVTSWGNPLSEHKATLQIKDPNFFTRCFLYGDVGFGESYVAGEWETDDLPALIAWMILNIESHPAMSGSLRRFSPLNWFAAFNRMLYRLRPNNRPGSRRNIEEHYDLSNDFFMQFLDPTMTYSAAFFETGRESLEEAQRLKFEKLCQKLRLSETDHVLEIGSGWGGFAVYAARQYGCRITTVTISREQYDYARRKIEEEGLSKQVDVRLQDYRDIRGSYDKIVSIEMLEAVGHDYLKTYFSKCHEVLKPFGILALQVITCPDSRYEKLRKSVDWIQKHIFPGSLLPSVAAINRAVNASGDMVLYNLEDMGTHYATTLSFWREAFRDRRETIGALGFSDAFIRKWTYYFSYCEAAFAMRNISVLQMVYTRPNNRRL